MATRMMRVCDVCDAPASNDALRFAWGSSFYETDLCAKHASDFVDMMETVIKSARKMGAGPKSSPSITSTPGPRTPRFDTKDVRAWAKTKGIEVNPKGRVPESLIQQYLDSLTS